MKLVYFRVRQTLMLYIFSNKKLHCFQYFTGWPKNLETWKNLELDNLGWKNLEFERY